MYNSVMARGDLVIACGKGHEQSMAFGSVEYPWDDREALRGALRGTPVYIAISPTTTPGRIVALAPILAAARDTVA